MEPTAVALTDSQPRKGAETITGEHLVHGAIDTAITFLLAAGVGVEFTGVIPGAQTVPTWKLRAIIQIEAVVAHLVQARPSLAVTKFEVRAVLIDRGISSGIIKSIAIIDSELSVPSLIKVIPETHTQTRHVKGRAGI